MSRNTGAQVARGRAYARKVPNHFFDWCSKISQDPFAANRRVFASYGAYLIKEGILKPRKKIDKTVKVVESPVVVVRSDKKELLATSNCVIFTDLTKACSVTGFIRRSCGCNKCKYARLKNS